MGVRNILEREHEIINYLLPRLKSIEGVTVLADHITDRLGVLSFYVTGLHYNLGVKLLNDHFGIQVRGGCSCAGTYGHYLLHVDKAFSNSITSEINSGDLSRKPGWIRLSIHPTMTNEEVTYLYEAVREVAANHHTWGNNYAYNRHTNEFTSLIGNCSESDIAHELLAL